jgi:hypothetical protein
MALPTIATKFACGVRLYRYSSALFETTNNKGRNLMKRNKLLKGLVVLTAIVSMAAVASCGGSSSSGGGGEVDPAVCGGAALGCATGSVMQSDGSAWDATDPAVTVSIMPVVAGAQVIKAASGTTLADANAQGWFTADNIDEGERVICFSATGYFEICKTVTIIGANTTAITPVPLLSKGTAMTVVNVNSGAAAPIGNTTTGAGLRFDVADSVCDASGTVVTGDIDCFITPIDTTTDAGLALSPGNFRAVRTDGTTTGMMISSAMMAVSCEQDGADVQICAGKTAGVRIPIYGDDTACNNADTNPLTIDGWRYDEATGIWVEYDTVDFTINCGGTAPGTTGADQYYEGLVDHFSWINGDKLVDDTCLSGTVIGSTGGNANALTTVRCYGSGWQNEVYAGTDGAFCAPVPVGRSYTCTAGDSTRWLDAADVITGTAPATVVEFPVASCPADGCTDIGEFIFAEPVATTTLTWGALPSDLDSHFIPEGGTQIYYGNLDMNKFMTLEKGSLTSSPYISLDTDDTSSYGPEVTTALSQAADGTYRFCVRNYSGETAGGLCASSAQVRVYMPNTGSGSVSVSETLDVPTSCPSGEHLLWQVYEITLAGGIVTSYETLGTIVDSASPTTTATECFE